jgi:hypothetical protein
MSLNDYKKSHTDATTVVAVGNGSVTTDHSSFEHGLEGVGSSTKYLSYQKEGKM